MKLILIIFIYFSLFLTSFANEYIEKEGYNFTIGTIDSMDSIIIPDGYKKDNVGKIPSNNKIYLIKIRDFNIFSSNQNIDLDKELYLYIEPSESTFNVNYYKVGKKIIFRSDIQLFNNDFYDPLYYKPSILDLFYNDKNSYIIYNGGIGYFSCIENNKFNIDIISPENEKYFYSSLAFINPTIFEGDKNNIFQLEKK